MRLLVLETALTEVALLSEQIILLAYDMKFKFNMSLANNKSSQHQYYLLHK